MAKLGARVLRAVVNTNSWDFANQLDHQQGTAEDLYFQIVNQDYNVAGTPPGIRYLPAAGSTVTITLPSFDAAKVVTLTATQPFSGDLSIFKAAILSTHDFASGNLVVTLTESAVVKRIVIVNGLRVQPTDPSRCVSGY
jgi:hypothetical protein